MPGITVHQADHTDCGIGVKVRNSRNGNDLTGRLSSPNRLSEVGRITVTRQMSLCLSNTPNPYPFANPGLPNTGSQARAEKHHRAPTRFTAPGSLILPPVFQNRHSKAPLRRHPTQIGWGGHPDPPRTGETRPCTFCARAGFAERSTGTPTTSTFCIPKSTPKTRLPNLALAPTGATPQSRKTGGVGSGHRKEE